MSEDLRAHETHFAFGSNWASYSRLIGPDEIRRATDDLVRLLGTSTLTGKTFLDVGCGSGLHALAAIRLGASRVHAIDLDPQSVLTTREVLGRFAADHPYQVDQVSVFDLKPESLGRFDVVYSWGVLHHTGDMIGALKAAANLVADGGLFVFALYRRTYCDRLWVIEKRWYSAASPRSQQFAQDVFVNAYQGVRRFAEIVGARRRGGENTEQRARGMDFRHDVHDWLGGYPYDTTKKTHGIFGASCDEYRYQNQEPQDPH